MSITAGDRRGLGARGPRCVEFQSERGFGGGEEGFLGDALDAGGMGHLIISDNVHLPVNGACDGILIDEFDHWEMIRSQCLTIPFHC